MRKDTSSRQRFLEILNMSPSIYTYLWCSSRHVTYMETHRRKGKLYLSVLFNDAGNCWIIVVSAMDEGRSLKIGGIVLMRRNRSSRRERPLPMPICSQIPDGLAWDWVGFLRWEGRRITARALTGPVMYLSICFPHYTSVQLAVRAVDSSWNVMAHGDAREGKWRGKLTNGVGSQYPSHYLGTWCIQHYYQQSKLMRTPRLPVVDWTDALRPI